MKQKNYYPEPEWYEKNKDAFDKQSRRMTIGLFIITCIVVVILASAFILVTFLK